MNIRFRTARLRQTFEEAAVAYRAWGKPVGDRYIRRVRYILDAPSIHELFQIRSLRLHPLAGQFSGRHAMTLIDRWRLIVTIEAEFITIEEVTNYYGD